PPGRERHCDCDRAVGEQRPAAQRTSRKRARPRAVVQLGPGGGRNLASAGGCGMSTLIAPSPPNAAALTSSPPQRVCLVAEAGGGGVGRHFLDLAGGLAERGLEVTAIYSPRRRDASFRERLKRTAGVRFVESRMRRSVGPGDAADLWRLIRQIRSAGPFD